MKPIRFLLLLVIFASCKNADVNKGERQVDSCTVTEGNVEACLSAEDSIVVMKDIVKCDSMIRLEKDTNVLFMLYQQKVNLLAGIGKVRDAYYNQGLAMRLLPEDDGRRLEYEAFGAYLQNDMDRYSVLLHKAIDDYKKNPDDATLTLSQATCYTLLGDDEASKSVLKKFLNHQEDQAILFAFEDYPLFKKQVLEGRSKLVELLKSGDR